ncbi:hypothetical protein BH11ARM1_BH11ARM1_10710 [soil metagenome]
MLRDSSPIEGYPEPYGLLCSILQDATRDWRAELWEEVGADAAAWQVRPGAQSIGGMIFHMICCELFWFEMVALREGVSDEDKEIIFWNKIDVDNGHWPEVPVKPLSWYFELQDKYRARTLEAVKRWDPADTAKPFHGDEEVTLRWVLGHVIQHESYHGGQIVLLYDLWKASKL